MATAAQQQPLPPRGRSGDARLTTSDGQNRGAHFPVINAM